MKTIKRPTASAFDKPKDEIDAATMREIIDIGNNQIWVHIQPLLTGRSPQIQAAILAHITSLWLSAYATNGITDTKPILMNYVSLVVRLTKLNSSVLQKMTLQ